MKNRVPVLFFILILLINLPLIALPKLSKKADNAEDMTLFEIDKLIKKTEFEQALKQLNTYLENNPENFDNAQTRIARIMRARGEYRENFEILVETFAKINKDSENDEENSDDLAFTDEESYYAECNKIKDNLRSIEHNPPYEIQQVLSQIDSTITLNYVRPRAEKILRLSSKLAQEGDYVAAVTQLREGFEFFKVDYYIQWEDYPEIITETEKYVASLDANLTEFESDELNQKMKAAVQAFNENVRADFYEHALGNLSEIQKYFKEYALLREKIFANAQQLQQLFDRQKEIDPEATSTDASYLPFLVRFITGNPEQKTTGVAGVLNSQIDKYVIEMNDSAIAMLNKYYSDYVSLVRGNFQKETPVELNSAVFTSGIKKYASLNKSVINTFDYAKTSSELDIYENPVLDYVLPADFIPNLVDITESLYAKTVQVNSMWNFQTSNFNKLVSDISNSEREKVVNSLFESVAQMGNLVGIKSAQELGSYVWSGQYLFEKRQEWSELQELYTAILDKIFIDSSDMLNQSWEKISSYYTQQSDLLVKDIENHNAYTQKYYDGFYVKLTDSQHKEFLRDSAQAVSQINNFEVDESFNTGIYYCYPDIAKNLTAYTQRRIDTDITTINGYSSLINSVYTEHPQWSNDDGISKLVGNTFDYFNTQIEKLNSLRSESREIAADADEKQQNYKDELRLGDERYEYAKWVVGQEDFDLARRNLEEASQYYTNALTYQDDDTQNNIIYEKLQNLRDQIVKAENEYVVKEVRQYINTAWTEFYAGRYDEASDQLRVAENRWKTTNSMENEEIKKLVRYVNNARSSQEGFEILPSDPLYTEMSQRLSSANQFYESGAAKYEKGNKAEGNTDFAAAEEKINEVKNVYPLNLNAQLLSLKIERIQSPSEFKTNFKDKIEEAVNQCKNKDTEMQEKGYAFLKAYYELEPGYAGLRDKLVQAEIDMGKRPRPIDNSSKNRAQSLYVQATRTFNAAGTDKKRLQQALNLVDQAIDLDNNLRDATSLKDKILVAIGGSASPEFTPTDRITFNQAQLDLDNNNIRRARNTLEKMLQAHPIYSENEEFMSLYNEAKSL